MNVDRFQYQKINVSLEPIPNIESAANRWAAMGWRTVAVVGGDRLKGFADVILVEKKFQQDPVIAFQYVDSEGKEHFLAPEDVTLIYASDEASSRRVQHE